jgi:hypothetical protein
LIALIAGCSNNPPAPVDVTLAPPSQGFQLATPEFDVASGTEVQACYFFKAPDIANGQDYYVNKIEVAQNPGSHHMNVFRQNTIVGLKGPNADGTGVVSNVRDETHCALAAIKTDPACACFNSANWADWPLVVNSQQQSDPSANYILQMPANVGTRFHPGEILMLQTHYVNATTQKTPGRGKVLDNFYQMTDTTGVQELGTLFATEQSISICRDNPTPSFTGFCHFNNTSGQPITIFAANGHFHSRGTDFTMCTWDGLSTNSCVSSENDKFYESTTWDEPPMMTGLAVPVPTGMAAMSDGGTGDGGAGGIAGGVRWTCSYKWAPSPACPNDCSCLKDPVNCCYKFGPIVEVSEHCNAFVYYYPKIASTDIICQ